ncbi:hypothetical protein ACFQX6_13870 [Streptosporangium lutulentum]
MLNPWRGILDLAGDRGVVGSEPDHVAIGLACHQFGPGQGRGEGFGVGEGNRAVRAAGDDQGGLANLGGAVGHNQHVVEKTAA